MGSRLPFAEVDYAKHKALLMMKTVQVVYGGVIAEVIRGF